ITMTRGRLAGALATLPALFLPLIAHAGLLPECAKQAGGCITLDSAIQLGVNYGRFLLGLSGSVALVIFVWGGFLMLTSAGNPKKVQGGKDKMVAAIIGLIIIFSAFTVVKFALTFLDPTEKYDVYLKQKK
ncbi:MAG: pilin, partial [Patescibacteria group bacterium]